MKVHIANELRHRPQSLSAGSIRKKEVWSNPIPFFSPNHNDFPKMGNNNNKVFVENKKKDGDSHLAGDKVLQIIGYFDYSSIISHGLDDYLQGNIRGKLERKSSLSYDSILYYFSWIIFLRNVSLAFIEDLTIRAYLGETERIRPERQLVMIATIWSIYVALVFTVYSRSTKCNFFTWLSPFQLLRGQATPKSHGLNAKMTDDWYNYTLRLWRRYLAWTWLRWFLGLSFLIWLSFHRWSPSKLLNTLNTIWITLMAIWGFYSSHLIYISYIYFNSLCYYFRIRYAKVNYDIDSIISTDSRMKSADRTETLHHVLIEHNELCLKINEYNRFWAKYLMSTYFFLVAIICFTTFQAFFTTNVVIVRVLMAIISFESAYVLTKISISAALLSNTAHASYAKLIRVTFDKYPVELQIQLRMFIQRLSGPTIGFYCLDLFEITYTTYASIVAALGQNFLLIVDFVRSYAEVGKERESNDLLALTQFTESMFNSTLSAIGVFPDIDDNMDNNIVYRNSTL